VAQALTLSTPGVLWVMPMAKKRAARPPVAKSLANW